MITTAIALLIAIQGPQQDSSGTVKQSAAAILSKAFSRYAEAQSLSGTIKGTQTANGATISSETDLQYDRPSKMYLHQARNGKKGGSWLVVSDGQIFSYDKPLDPSIHGQPRYTEYVTQHGVTQTVGDLYIAAEQSLGELNPILDIAIAAPARLKKLKAQWASLHYAGKQTIDNQVVQVVSGDWRSDAVTPPTGQFEAYITDDGELVRYVLSQRFGFRDKTGQTQSVTVRSQWDADLRIGLKNDQTVYQVTR